jgi:hypothetical protein
VRVRHLVPIHRRELTAEPPQVLTGRGAQVISDVPM